ncbi:MAG: ATP-grasp domain-containing protein [Candidatus Pacebacteria bacterium]|nr:ATP-grasp domain-containing protein [Candidatus Paceibacterota bacterium]
MEKKEKNIILFVNYVPDTAIKEIREYGKKIKKDLKVAIIKDKGVEESKLTNSEEPIDLIIPCDFDDPVKIMKALLPYKEEFLAITCRQEKNIPDFAKIIPNVPYLKTPTSKSLEWSVEKYMMRRRFNSYDKKITPRYLLIKDCSKETLEKIKEKVGFPLMVKPSNLAASLMVSVCFYEEELRDTLKACFRKINRVYEENDRQKEPHLLVEQFMEGDMYSIDAYVNSRGGMRFCPLVKVKTGKQIGFDDFFGYQQMTPAKLKTSAVLEAEEVARKAVHALGLRSNSAHVELMRTEDGWKVIEVGPRLGGWRDYLYKLSFGINHSLNDVLNRIPQKPIIPKKVKGHSAFLKIFAKKEGKLKSIKGLKKVKELESCVELKVDKKVGDMCKFAKNGGRAVCVMVFFNEERSKLLADIRRMEKALKIET